jgi:hypothetical protein
LEGLELEMVCTHIYVHLEYTTVFGTFYGHLVIKWGTVVYFQPGGEKAWKGWGVGYIIMMLRTQKFSQVFMNLLTVQCKKLLLKLNQKV